MIRLSEMVLNFGKRTYGQDVFIDVAHKPDSGAAGKVEWTPMGVDAAESAAFLYLSSPTP